MNPTLRMILGCMLPLLAIFALPLFGIDTGFTLFVFIVLMFACHLGMMGHHKRGSDHGGSRSDKGDRDHEQT
ncbi:MAG: hypothetical protein SCH98_09020 [Deferrisomatales bacterium]|nr:hypothetical protein [Deferrisomatales bacterium]